MSNIHVLTRNAKHVNHLRVSPDLIYLDPPFNVNRRLQMGDIGFDDVWSSEADYAQWYTRIVSSMFEVLKTPGTLYCHNNFLNNALLLAALTPKLRATFDTNIAWRRSHPHNNIRNGWGNIVDSILVFKKGSPYFQVAYVPLDEKYAAGSFNNHDLYGKYALTPITGEKSRPGNVFEYKGMSPEYGWRKTLTEIKALDAAGRIHFGKRKPYLKLYREESRGAPVQNFWNDVHPITRSEVNHREYPTQKPVLLLERIIRASCPPNGLVLDPFCGSGTTCFATLNVGEGRSCIVSDVNPDALSICRNALTVPYDTDGQNVWPESA